MLGAEPWAIHGWYGGTGGGGLVVSVRSMWSVCTVALSA